MNLNIFIHKKISTAFISPAKCFFSITATILLLLITGKLQAQQPFPISLDANGGEVFVEAMDYGPDGDIYVTGSVKNYMSIEFSPNCGDDVIQAEPTGGDRIFVARLHADPTAATLDDVVWMVIGTSTVSNTGGIFSGKDIEVASDGSVFFTGTLVGRVEFEKVIGAPSYPIAPACFSNNAFRHFVGRIAADGEPEWITDTNPGSMLMNTYGEGITLDEENDRLFTGGYVGNAVTAPLNFTNPGALCLPGCGFTVVPTIGSPTVGFVTQYSLSGNNRQAFQIGEKVMALEVDEADPGHIWVTGSIFDTDSDVLLAKIPVNIVTPPCAVYAPSIIPVPGPDGAIGLDIAYTNNDRIAITGAFETACFFSGAGLITTPPGMSDLFVAVYNPGTASFSAAKSTTMLTPFSATNQSYLLRNSCIAADEVSSNHVIIAYDKDVDLNNYADVGYIITKELTINLFPPGPGYTSVATVQMAPCACPPVPVNPAARAMEIEFGNMGSSGNSYLAGDYKAQMTIGTCMLNGTGSWNDGFVGRIADGHSIFFRETAAKASDESLFIYPNPSADGEVNIRYTFEEEASSSVLRIYDLTGKLMQEKEVLSNKGENEVRLDLDLSNGTYMVQLLKEEKVFATQKLIILK